MTSISKQLEDEINELLKEFFRMRPHKEKGSDVCGFPNGKIEFTLRYEAWYTRSRRVIKQIIPERIDDFDSCYKPLKVRDQVRYDNYTIQDYQKEVGFYVAHGDAEPDYVGIVSNRLHTQWLILGAALKMLSSKVASIRNELLFSIGNSDLEAARDLRSLGHLRASGAICGVVLEKHLREKCSENNLKSRKKLTIGVCNDLLKEGGVVSMPSWRKIQYLADIRNSAVHDVGKEPTDGEISELISGVASVLSDV